MRSAEKAVRHAVSGPTRGSPCTMPASARARARPPPEEHAGAAACALSAAGCATYGTGRRRRAWGLALAWPSVVRIDTREGPSTVLEFCDAIQQDFFAEMAWASVPQVVERDTEPGVFEVFAEIRVDFLNSTAGGRMEERAMAVRMPRVSRAWLPKAQQVLAMDPARARCCLWASLVECAAGARVGAALVPMLSSRFWATMRLCERCWGGACLCACAELRRDVPVSGIVQGSWC